MQNEKWIEKLVPTLRVGMRGRDAPRRLSLQTTRRHATQSVATLRSHAERGNTSRLRSVISIALERRPVDLRRVSRGQFRLSSQLPNTAHAEPGYQPEYATCDADKLHGDGIVDVVNMFKRVHVPILLTVCARPCHDITIAAISAKLLHFRLVKESPTEYFGGG